MTGITTPICGPICGPVVGSITRAGVAGVSVPAIDSFRADTAAAPLAIASPDGFGELTHPSVYDAGASGWNGKRYWMAATPYHGSDSALENPCIYCADSLDGPWVAPDGLTNPIEAFPGGTDYNSDTHLVWGRDGYLYCVWRQVNGSTASESLYSRRSTDGVTWGDKAVVYTALQADRRLVSPAVNWDGSQWVLYAVNILPSPNVLVRMTADSLHGTWSAPESCTISMPSGRECWHLDAKVCNGAIFLLLQDTTLDSSSGGALYLCRGTSATEFERTVTPIISPASNWSGLNYRSCMVPTVIGGKLAFDLLYSGIASGVYHIGHTMLQWYDAAAYAAEPAIAIAGAVGDIAPYKIGDNFTRADGALGTSTGGEAWVVSAGTPNVISNKAGATADANTRAYLESGLADLYADFELSASTSSTQSFVIFRFSNSTNYWRAGVYNMALILQKIVAGVTTSITNVGDTLTTVGSPSSVRIGVRCDGDAISVLLDGKVAFIVTDSFNATATKVGIQTQSSLPRFDNFFVRELVGGK